MLPGQNRLSMPGAAGRVDNDAAPGTGAALRPRPAPRARRPWLCRAFDAALARSAAASPVPLATLPIFPVAGPPRRIDADQSRVHPRAASGARAGRAARDGAWVEAGIACSSSPAARSATRSSPPALLSRFVECEPEASFTVAAGPVAVSLFLDTPRLEETIAIVKRRRALHWLDLWRRLRGRRWKAVIDMRGSGLAYALWADRRFVRRSVRQPPGAPPLHKALEAAATIGALDSPPSPFLYTSAAREARADELVGRGGPVLAIAPAATWPPKTWPAERFAAARGRAHRPGGTARRRTGAVDRRSRRRPVLRAHPRRPAALAAYRPGGTGPADHLRLLEAGEAVHRQRLRVDASLGRRGSADARPVRPFR